MRVAVVGGGGVGLATALHLAPLIKSGLIGGPIDVYDAAEQQSSTIGDMEYCVVRVPRLEGRRFTSDRLQ